MNMIIKRFKKAMALLLNMTMVITSISPVYAVDYTGTYDETGIGYTDDSDLKYSSYTFGADRAPYLTEDKDMMIPVLRDQYESFDDVPGYALIDTERDEAVRKFREALIFSSNIEQDNQASADGIADTGGNRVKWVSDSYSGVSYNPYYNYDTKKLSGRAMAEAEFDLYINGLKALQWNEFNGAIDTVISEHNEDIWAAYNSTYAGGVFGRFLNYFWEELKTENIIAPNTIHNYKYDIKTYTSSWGDSYESNLQYGWSEWEPIGTYPEVEDTEVVGYGGFSGGGNWARYYEDNDTYEIEHSFGFNSEDIPRQEKWSDRQYYDYQPEAIPFGKLKFAENVYYGYDLTLPEESQYILFDFAKVWPVSIPKTEYINKKVVTQLQVGDVLAPGAVIVNGYNVEEGKFYYSVVYGEEKFNKSSYGTYYGYDESIYNTPSGYPETLVYYDITYFDDFDDVVAARTDDVLPDPHYLHFIIPDDLRSVTYDESDKLAYVPISSDYYNATSKRLEFSTGQAEMGDGTQVRLEYKLYLNEHNQIVSGETVYDLIIKDKNTNAVIYEKHGTYKKVSQEDEYSGVPISDATVYYDEPFGFEDLAETDDISYMPAPRNVVTWIDTGSGVKLYEFSEMVYGYNDEYEFNPYDEPAPYVLYIGQEAEPEDPAHPIKIKYYLQIKVGDDPYIYTGSTLYAYTLESDVPAFMNYANTLDGAGNYVAGVERRYDFTSDNPPWNWDSSIYPTIKDAVFATSYYAMRMPKEVDVDGYEIVSIQDVGDSFKTTVGVRQDSYDTEVPEYLLYGRYDPGEEFAQHEDCVIKAIKVKRLGDEEEKPEYTVSFDTNGGTEIADQTVTEGNTVTRPTDPTKPGSEFDRWYANPELTTEYDFSTQIYEDTTIYAGWTQTPYTVDFESNGGDAVPSQTKYYGEKVNKPANPYKYGFTFNYWCSDEELTAEYNFNAPVTNNMTLYAKYTPNDYTVAFDSKGGTNVPSQTVAYGTKATKPANPTLDDYVFKEWMEDEDLTTAFDFNTPITGNTTLYAFWKEQYCTVSFNSNGGSSVDDIEVQYLNTIEEPDEPVKDGFNFVRWYEDEELKIPYAFGEPVEDDMILYAKWANSHCTVTFDTDGGSSVPSQTVAFRGKATKPADPVKTDCEFGGWFADSTKETPFDFNTQIEEDTTIYADWITEDEEEFTIRFHSNGGSEVPSQTRRKNQKATKPENPERYGYSFTKWYATSALAVPYDFNTLIKEDKDLYAGWSANDFRVSFNTRGGSSIDDQLVEYNKKAQRPNNPTKYGFTFVDWYTEAECENIYNFNTPVTRDIILYADWSANDYTVNFVSNGGTDVPSQTVKYNQKATKPDDPVNYGYYFDKWYEDQELTDEFDFNTPITANKTLYAGWNIKSYTISFDSNGGSPVPSQSVEFFKKVTRPADPTRTGHSFDAWYSDPDMSIVYDFNHQVVDDMTLTAGWDINSYEVSFDSNGGSPVPSQSIEYQSCAVKPDDPTKNGYTFDKWYADKNLTEAYDFSTPISEETTIYAGWTVNKYTVTFHSNGGSEVPSQQVEYNKKATYPVAPTRYGYAFDRWFSDAELKNEYDFNTLITGNKDLYADWTACDFVVTFETNGGNAIPPQGVMYNEKATKPADPVKYGYTFTKWYADPALETEYDFNTLITEDKTIYAGYTTNDYTVSFETNGGNTIPSQTVKYMQKATRPADPEKYGYTFTKWYANAMRTIEYDFESPITKDTTIYADWATNDYTVTFETNGGNEIFPQKVKYNQKAKKPADPEKYGYTFDKWYKDAELTTEYDFYTPVTKDITVYAGYTTNDYTVTFETNGGNTIPPQTVKYNTKATKPADPEKYGYTFDKWYTNSKLTAEYDFETPVTENITIYAGYTTNDYTVSFETNGGNTIPSQTVEYNTTATRPADPVKYGYTFAKWYKNIALTNEFDFSTPITADTTLYADWDINSYQVTFETNGGSEVPPQMVVYQKPIVKPADPVKYGYTFDKWYKDAELKVEHNITDPITKETTLYAGYTTNDYTVSFETNGGNTIPSQTVEYNTKATKPTDPEKYGYTFTKWYKDSGLSTEFSFEEPITKDMTLYAGWDINSYQVTFETNGGSEVSPQLVVYQKPITKPTDPVKYGYTFDKWYKDAELKVEHKITDPITKETTLYAGYTTNDYTVSFETNGGNAIPSQTVEYNTTATRPANPAKYGYTFTKWYSDEALSHEFSFTTPIIADITLYAGWDINSYQVSFETNGGSEVPPQLVVYQKPITKPADPVKYGYTFDKWYKDAELKTEHKITDPITKETTLYAGYTTNSYTVTFNSMGGSSVPSQTVEYNTKATKPADPSKTGYAFTKWYTSADLTKEFDFETPVTKDITLYADWDINFYRIKFNTDGGTHIPDQMVKYLDKVTEPRNSYKTGYDLGKWYVDPELTVEYDFDTPVTKEIDLYAGWDPKDYTVTFETNGGNEIPSQTVKYNTKAAKPADPERYGYTFTTWYADVTLSTPYTFEEPVTEDITIYAGWSTNDYTVTFDTRGGSAIDKQIVKYYTKAQKPADPERYGYTFTTWYADEELTTEYDYNSPVTKDITIYADWSTNDYTVTFETNGGNTIPSQTVKYMEKATRPDDPERYGYTFNGWFEDDGLSKEYSFGNPITKDTTIYAGWTTNDYTVTFDSDGGSPVPAQKVKYLEKATEPEAPFKYGYTFDRWYLKDGDGDMVDYDFDAPVTKDITLYAKWTTNDYTVTFDSNGGSAVPKQTVKYNTKAEKPQDPTYIYREFKYWYLNDPAEEFDFETPITRDITLIAKWEGQLSYQKKLDNGSDFEFAWNDSMDKTRSVFEDEKDDDYLDTNNNWTAVMGIDGLDYADATKGYEEELPKSGDYSNSAAFDINVNKYISTDAEIQDVIETSNYSHTKKPLSISVSVDKFAPQGAKLGSCAVYRIHNNNVVKIDSIFDPATNIISFENDDYSTFLLYYGWHYNVIFETNGGSPVPSQSVLEGTTPVKPDAPVKSDAEFGGWYSDETLTTAYDFTKPVMEDTVIYAKWIPVHTVSFNTHGGNAIASQKVIDGQTAHRPLAPEKKGYAFAGWFSSETYELEYDFNTPVTANRIIHAKWEEIIPEFTVEFNTDGGFPVPDDQIVLRGEKAKKPAVSPFKDGYTFKAWYLNDEIYNFGTPVTSDVVITAKWDAVKVYRNVTFDANGGIGEPEPQVVEKGKQAYKPSIVPYKEGYHFVSWQLNGVDYDFNRAVTQDITLKAKWSENDVYYTVKFDSNGGNKTPATQKVLKGNKANKPDDGDTPEKEGYSFEYWEYQNGEYDFDTSVTKDMTLRAKWKKKEVPNVEKSITTSAITNLGTKYMLAGTEVIGITDTVKYSGYCTPGKQYTLEGVLMDKSTNKPILDASGQPVIRTETFTGAAYGEIPMTFIFNPSAIPGGTTIVVFQTIKDGNTIVAEHKDINCYEQSIFVMGFEKVQTGLFPKLKKIFR